MKRGGARLWPEQVIVVANGELQRKQSNGLTLKLLFVNDISYIS